MKKILSYLLILNFVFFSGFSTIQARAEELSTEQEKENENEEINLDEKVESDEKTDIIQNNEDKTINSDEELDIEDIQQEDQNDDADKLNTENQTESETKESDEVINEQLIENEIHIEENEKDSSTRVAADSEKPVIDTSSIWIDNTSVYYGDTVTIRVKVTDNDEIGEVYIQLKNSATSNFISKRMSFNNDIGLYEIAIHMDDTFVAGAWGVDYISAKDVTGNYESCSFGDFNHSFTLISDTDSESPVIDEKSFYKDKDTVNFGESIFFKIRITDNDEINFVQISFKNKEVLNFVSKSMQYNSNDGYYECALTIDETMPEGNWIIDYISATDKIGNYSFVDFDNMNYFTVINPNADSEPPYIDTSSLKINNQNPITDDIVNIQIKITDNVAIDRATIDLRNLDTSQGFYSEHMTYNPDINMYEYSFKVDDTITVGHWTVDITTNDLIGNHASECFYGNQYVLVITDKGENIHDWDDGVITKNPTSTEEGIKTYTCKVWACGMTKTESVPTLSDNNENNNNKPEEPSEKPPVSPTPDSGNDDNINDNVNSESNNTEDNNSSDNTSSTPSFWAPTTEEEQLRYSCFGKENVQYTTLNNQPFNVDIQNAMQGEKCFEVFKSVADDYTIARTYNIFPLTGMQKYSTDEKVTLSLTIPETLRQENREFKLICVSQNGAPYIFEDQDEDSNTITISTDKFYAYALVYKDMK